MVQWNSLESSYKWQKSMKTKDFSNTRDKILALINISLIVIMMNLILTFGICTINYSSDFYEPNVKF